MKNNSIINPSYILFTAVIAIFSLTANAQPSIQWQKTVGDSTVQRADGQFITFSQNGYILGAGGDEFTEPATGQNFTPVTMYKTDLDGNLLWQRHMNPVRSQYSIYNIPDGQGGGFYAFIAASAPNRFDNDIIVGHISATGDSLWQQRIGGSEDDITMSLNPTPDGGFILNAFKFNGLADAWLLKFSAGGGIEWDKTYGGSNSDGATTVIPLNKGYIFFGITSSNDGIVKNHHGPNGTADIWVVRLDELGNILWQKALGGSDDEVITDVIQTADGGYFFTAFSRSGDGDVGKNHGGTDGWNVKLDSSGNIVWKQILGGSGDEYMTSCYESPAGGFVTFGSTESQNGDIVGNHGGYDVWGVKFTATGAVDWNRAYGTSGLDIEYLSKQAPGNGYYVVASGDETEDGDRVDMVDNSLKKGSWLFKVTEQGTIAWQRRIGPYFSPDKGIITPDASLLLSGSGAVTPETVAGKIFDMVLVKLCAGFSDTLALTLGTFTICNGDSMLLKAKPGFAKYVWSTGETTQAIQVKKKGKYWVKVYDESGCSALSYPAMQVLVNPSPVKTVGVKGDLSFCEGDSVVFTPVEKGLVYKWNNGDTSAAITVKTTGSFFVKITNTLNCSSTSSVFNTVRNSLPDTPVIKYANEILYTKGGYASYRWYRNGQLLTDTIANKYKPHATGTYKVSVKTAAGCGQGSKGFVLSVLADDDLNFTAYKVNNTVQLQWQSTSVQPGDYFVVERSGDAINFIDIEHLTAIINTAFKYNFIDKIATGYAEKIYYRIKKVNTNGQFLYSRIIAINPTSVDISITPNPAGKSIRLVSPEAINNAEITITAINGKKVYSAKHSLSPGAVAIINIQGLANGSYIAAVYSNNLLIKKLMFIKNGQ
jgi:hypothetical protein